MCQKINGRGVVYASCKRLYWIVSDKKHHARPLPQRPVPPLPSPQKIEVAHVPNTAVMVDDDLMLLDDRPGVPDLTDLSLSRIAAAPCLREICLSDAVVTDAGLVALASSCQSLERVTLDGCPHVNDPGVCALSRLPRLKAVSLSDCGSLSDRTAEALGGAACLTELSMTPCAGLSDRGLAALGGSRSLRSVSLVRGRGGWPVWMGK